MRWARRALVPFIAAYAIANIILATNLSLWVDEILQLIGTRDAPDLRGLLEWVRMNPGGVPFGYVSQRLMFDLFGYSTAIARLPSLIASLFGCACIPILAARLRLKSGLFALVLFALLPLQFRYASEGRPYAEALALSLCSTVAFLSLCARPNLRSLSVYVLTLTAAAYTQPLALSVGIAHAAWCAWRPDKVQRARILRYAIAGNCAAAALFLPWLLHVGSEWKTTISGSSYSFHPGFSILAITFREVCGNYVIAVILAATVIYAIRLSNGAQSSYRLLWMTILIPFAGALLTDAIYGYFFASRQLIFIVPGVILLSAEGILKLASRYKRAAMTLVGLLMIALVVQDGKAFVKTREDWALAASCIQRELDAGGGCVLTAPNAWEPLYSFFLPELEKRRCGQDLKQAQRIILVSTPYSLDSQRAEARSRLDRAGFAAETGGEAAGGTRIRIFRQH